MHRAGYEFFAGAAFAAQEHRHVVGGHLAHQVKDVLHLRASADEAVPAPPFRGFLLQAVEFAAEVEGLQRIADNDLEPVVRQRFGQVVVGAEFHGLDGGFHLPVSGKHDHQLP